MTDGGEQNEPDPESKRATEHLPASGDVGASQRTLFDGRYRVLRTLGSGGFGDVFQVEDELDPRNELALKVLREKHVRSTEFESRFRTEIRILRSLSHPGIPQIFNDGRTASGDYYFTMSLVHGRTLDVALKEDGAFQEQRVRHFLLQLLDILQYAHERGIVHRDLKPANIVIDASDPPDVKVLDFGIARLMHGDGVVPATGLQPTAGPIGTPRYMSPEQSAGRSVDERTDLYCLGIIAYEMTAGEPPGRETNLTEFANTSPQARIIANLLSVDPEGRLSLPAARRNLLRLERGSLSFVGPVVLLVASVAVLLLVDPLGWNAGEPEPGIARAEAPSTRALSPAAPIFTDPETEASLDNELETAALSAPKSDRTATILEFEQNPQEDSETPVDNTAGEPSEDGQSDREVAEPKRPEVHPSSPVDQHRTNASSIIVEGSAYYLPDDVMYVEILGASVPMTVDGQNHFRRHVTLPKTEGKCELRFVAEPNGDNLLTRTVFVDRTPPAVSQLHTPAEPLKIEDGSWVATVECSETCFLLEDEGGERVLRLENGENELTLSMPEPDASIAIEPTPREWPLFFEDEAGNPCKAVISAELFSLAAKHHPIGRGFPPHVAFDPANRCFEIRTAKSVVDRWYLPASVLEISATEDSEFRSFDVATQDDRTEMALVVHWTEGLSDDVQAPEKPFLMDLRELTYRRYNDFLANKEEPAERHAPSAVVEALSYQSAAGFAEWAGKTLPTEGEWKWAATWNNEGHRRYPAGNDLEPAWLVFATPKTDLLVDRLAKDVSPWGLQGMATGAREWCTIGPADEPVVRGATSFRRSFPGRTVEADLEHDADTVRSWFDLDGFEQPRSAGVRCIIRLLEEPPEGR